MTRNPHVVMYQPYPSLQNDSPSPYKVHGPETKSACERWKERRLNEEPTGMPNFNGAYRVVPYNPSLHDSH